MMMALVTTSGVRTADVVAWVRAHRLYGQMVASDPLWAGERDDQVQRFTRTSDVYRPTYLDVVALLSATADGRDGGLPYATGHEPTGATVAARQAARTILGELADVLDAGQAEHLAGAAPEIVARHGDYYTRGWRPALVAAD